MSETMKKSELVTAICDRIGCTKREAEAFLDALASSVEAALTAGKKVNVPGIVRLETKSRPARMVRNPRTGETFEKKAGTAVKASPASDVRKIFAD